MSEKIDGNPSLKYNYNKDQIEKLIEETELQKICSNPTQWITHLEKLIEKHDINKITKTMRMLANPIRLKILLILMERDWACNCEFEAILNIHQTLVSHNLRQLRTGGFVSYKKQGQWKLYSITEEGRDFLEEFFGVIHKAPISKKKSK